MWQQTLTVCLLVMTVWAFGWFTLAQILRRNDIADVAWGPSFIVCCCAALYANTGSLLPQTLPSIFVLTFVTVWGLRLSSHILRRNWRKDEDYRYQQWRKEWGAWFLPRSFLQVFLLQAFLAIVVVSPALAVLQNKTAELTALVLLGAGLWLLGFLFEAVADNQLKEFLSHKKAKDDVIESGLWKYSRHPNYFGEITQWWAMFVMALGASAAWGSVIGPAVITLLIVKVSGIPLLEKKMRQNPKYLAYAKKTSVLLPLPPKK